MTYRRDLRAVHGELASAGLLSKDEQRLWMLRPLAQWREAARNSARLATVLSAYVALVAGHRSLAIERDRPGAYERERARLVSETAGDSDLREFLLDLLDEVWHLVPYCADPVARVEVLAWARPRTHFARRYWGDIVELTKHLAETAPGALAAPSLPAHILLDEDGVFVATFEIARRTPSLSDNEIDDLAPLLLSEPKLAALAREYGAARFIRRLARSSALAVQMLCLSGYLSLSTLPAWAGLCKTWDVADELVVRLGADDGDPYSARTGGRSVVVTDEALDELELAHLLRYEDGAGRSDNAAWERAYTGCPGLREMLRALDPDADRVIVERLPMFPPRPSAPRVQGIEPDVEQLDLETQADLFVFGLRTLADRPHLLRVWVVAWATICRPKECLPCADDIVPLPGGGLAVHQDRRTSKSGASETCASASAVAVTGMRASWFPRRRRAQLTAHELHAHAEMLRVACRAVRQSWKAAGGRELPGQLAYFVRHAGSDRLRWNLAGRHHVLTRVLRHLSGVSDLSYTKVSEYEWAEALAELADMLSEVLP